MKWITTFCEKALAFDFYSNMIQVAIFTLQKYCPDIQPVILYDGENKENPLLNWLIRKNVQIIRTKTILFDSIIKADGINKTSWLLPWALGSFLRVDIPRIAREYKWEDNYILYSDCDLIFIKNCIEEILSIKPKYFAAAKEFYGNNTGKLNDGVLILNLKKMTESFDGFILYIEKNLNKLITGNALQQEAYSDYYQNRWEILPDELNWRPFYGKNDNASIIHFQGPKPFQKYLMINKQGPAYLTNLAKNDYLRSSLLWDEFYLEMISSEQNI